MKKIIITLVSVDSIAEKNGFKVGDIILKIDNETINSLEQCRDKIREKKKSNGVLDFFVQSSETLDTKEIKISFESTEDKNLGITFIEERLTLKTNQIPNSDYKAPTINKSGNTFINYTLQTFSILITIFSILGFLTELFSGKGCKSFVILVPPLIFSIFLYAISIIIRELRKINVNLINKKE